MLPQVVLDAAGQWTWFGVVSIVGRRGWILIIFWCQCDGLVRIPETQGEGFAWGGRGASLWIRDARGKINKDTLDQLQGTNEETDNR